ARLEEIQGYTQKQGSGTRHPEWIGPLHFWIEHGCNPLDVVDPAGALRRDIEVRIPARRPPIFGERIEQITLLAHCGPVARGDGPVLAFHIDANNAAWPVQQVGDHDADTLARSRRRSQRNSLLPR